MRQETHPRDDELMMAIDGELAGARGGELEAHLTHCWACRARRAELERSIERFIQAREGMNPPAIPPPEGPTARLRAQMAQCSPQGSPMWNAPVWIGMSLLAVTIAGGVWMTQQRARAGPLPDARLTPGATRSISRNEVCVVPADDGARAVPMELAHRVFEQYRIARPRPRAYEVDYLISPTLGGADDIRNLWPQPYDRGVWTSRVKDALEDHLRRMVCEGSIELPAAQQEIASDWIAAYKKHFRTERPLAAHALFVKDRPWE